MKSLLFVIGLAAGSLAEAFPSTSSFAANEIGLCGFSLRGLFTSKALYHYKILPNADLITGTPNPGACEDAVSRLEGVASRTPEENTLIAAAATGWLAASLKINLDRNDSGNIDSTIDVQDRKSLRDEQVMEIMAAQNAFLKYAPLLSERADFVAIASKIRASCDRVPACDIDPRDSSPRALQLMRDLLSDILRP